MKVFLFLRSLALFAAIIFSLPGHAQTASDYPKQRIRLITPFAAGATTDGFGTFMQQESVKWEKVIKTAGIKPE